MQVWVRAYAGKVYLLRPEHRCRFGGVPVGSARAQRLHHGGTKGDQVRVNGSTIKVKVGQSVPMMGGTDELVDGVAGSEYNGFLVATDFARPWEPTRSPLQMMLAQPIISNGFSARSMPLFTYTNDGAIDDDGCLGMVNNTPGFDATTLAEKCPDVKT